MIKRRRANLVAINGRAKPSLLDWTAVEDEIKSRSGENREQKFLSFVLDHIFTVGNPRIRHWRSDGGNDRGIDAVVIEEEEKRIHFVNTKCVKGYEKSAHNFPSSEVDKSLTFLDELIHKSSTLLKCNRPLAEAVKATWDCLEASPYTLHFHLCSNQSPLVAEERIRLSLNLKAKKISLEEHHLQILAGERQRLVQPRSKRLSFKSEALERTLGKARTVAGYVSVSEIARFVSDDTGELDKSLFHANIRSFLGKETVINREIANSLTGMDREVFECLNNGIKLVCESIMTTGGAHPVHLVNPQVVNGLQTANVLFAHAMSPSVEMEETSIWVHITETRDPELAKRIALATNSQQRISNRDLRANDELQIKLERELKKKGFTYLRKQGETSKSPAGQTIDPVRLGQIILAYLLDMPEKSKTSALIFSDLYDEIFDPRLLSSDKVIALHSLYRLVEDKKRFAKAVQRKVSREEYGEEWIIEGIFHALYAIKLFCVGLGVDHTDFEVAKTFVEDALEAVAECFKTTESSAYRYFRLVATKAAIEEEVYLRVMSTQTNPAEKRQPDLFDYTEP